MNEGKNPVKLQKLCDTRWMSWLPVASGILDQWTELQGFFRMKASENDYKALTLAGIFEDPSNLLYVTFLKSILREVHTVNLAFEQTNADITKVYSDLRVLFFSLSARVLKSKMIAETSKPGVLRSIEIQMLQKALSEAHNLRPLDRVNFGDAFQKVLLNLHISPEKLKTVRERCADYILCLCNQLSNRLPHNIETVEKMKNLAPRFALERIARPLFEQLPLDLVGE